jgi:phosphoribosylamine-glycine ligase
VAGYGVDSGGMGAAADKIDSIHDRVTDDATGVAKTTIEAKDFGRAHTSAGSPFTALLTKLAGLVTAEGTAMQDYSARLRDNRSEYDAAEWSNSDLFTKISGA